MIQITVSRESVSMGDDAFDNTLVIDVGEDWKIDRILKQIIDSNFLPKIYGGKATWSVAFDNPIAILAQQWKDPKFICDKDYPYPGKKEFINVTRLHFNYHAQQNPVEVFELLKKI